MRYTSVRHPIVAFSPGDQKISVGWVRLLAPVSKAEPENDGEIGEHGFFSSDAFDN